MLTKYYSFINYYKLSPFINKYLINPRRICYYYYYYLIFEEFTTAESPIKYCSRVLPALQRSVNLNEQFTSDVQAQYFVPTTTAYLGEYGSQSSYIPYADISGKIHLT